jgi:hypothetical protein
MINNHFNINIITENIITLLYYGFKLSSFNTIIKCTRIQMFYIIIGGIIIYRSFRLH